MKRDSDADERLTRDLSLALKQLDDVRDMRAIYLADMNELMSRGRVLTDEEAALFDVRMAQVNALDVEYIPYAMKRVAGLMEVLTWAERRREEHRSSLVETLEKVRPLRIKPIRIEHTPWRACESAVAVVASSSTLAGGCAPFPILDDVVPFSQMEPIPTFGAGRW